MLGRLYHYFADFRRIYAVLPHSLRRGTAWVFALVFVQGVLEVSSIVLMSLMAASLVAPERLMHHPVLLRVFEAVPPLARLAQEPLRFGLLVSSCVVVLIAARNAISALVAHRTNRLGERIALFAGEAIFHHFLYSPYILHLSGDSHAMYQAISWRGQLGHMIIYLMMVYTYLAIALLMTCMLVAATPGPVLLVMGAMLGLAAGVYLRLRGRMDKAGKDAAEWSRQESKVTMNAMNGVREMLIYRQQETFFTRFDEASTQGMPSRAFLSIGPSLPTWILESAGFFSVLAAYGVMWFWLESSPARIAVVLSMLMLVAWRVLPLLNRALSAMVQVRGSRHAALECLAAVEEALRHTARRVPVEPSADFSLREGISFSHACFRYPTAAEDCLRNLTFSIPRGGKIGIIGQSGAGKSTIAAMLSGLVEPTGGAMLVDGRRLTPADHAAYCALVGYVPQNPYILAGTLAENVAFSQWGKPWDEDRVRRACRMAELDVAEKRGIDIPLGGGGTGLSGGQAQRLSIARALYADPSVLILDEATSALDGGVERAIMDTIFALPRDITLIIIAHRLTTVERCDTLVWIENGQVRETGAPEDLLPRYEAALGQMGRIRDSL